MTRQEFYNQQNKNYNISGSRLQHLLDLIPIGQSLEILDIGCGQGYLAKKLVLLGHKVVGVDISNEALQLAHPYLTKSFCFNLEDETWPEALLAEKFDIIIATEVIEHLFWPVEFLNQLSILLKKDGHVIITTPNFLFWKNRLKMLFGFFEYAATGLLDFSHIRFFNYKYFKKTIQESQLKIIREHHFYPNFYKRKLNFIGKNWPGLFAYQFIVSLSKKD